MTFSHEFLMFQHGNHDTSEKLQYYPNFIMILLEELKTLREVMCTPCKQKWAPSSASTSRPSTSSNDNPTFHPQHPMLYYIFYSVSLYFMLTFFTLFVDMSNWRGYAGTCCFSFLLSIFLYYSSTTRSNRAQTPRVYPATPVSELPPSPVDFSYQFLVFQQGSHDTKERLEYYQSFIMILLGELKTQRETVCTSCEQKCALSKATRHRNQSLATSTVSTFAMRTVIPCNVDTPISPRMPETDILWRTPSPGSSSPPINEKIASDTTSLSTERRNKTNKPTFYAQPSSLAYTALAHTTIDVTFVHSFFHKNSVYCVCFSCDGRYLAVGTGIDKDGSIDIYEVESLKKYCELREYPSQYGSYTRPRPSSLSFSSDGRYLSVRDIVGRMIIWDIPKKRIRSIFQYNGWTRGTRFSPNGRFLVFVANEGLIVLNLRDYSRKVVCMCSHFDCSPNGQYIAAWHELPQHPPFPEGTRYYSLWILNMRTGKKVKRWYGHGNGLSKIKFTLDGKGLLCVYAHVIEKWDVSDAEPVLIKRFETNIYSSVISPDHRLLVYNNVLWDVISRKRQYTFEGHDYFICSVDFSPSGTYLAMGDIKGFVSLWKYAYT